MVNRTDDTLPAGYRLHWYQIQAILGDGGFGTTYLGRDTNLSQAVAIKEYFPRSYVVRLPDRQVRPRPGVDARFYQWGLKRFLDEARLLARFRHPNIVRVLSVFETHGTAYMVMELERGRSFSRAISDGALHGDGCILDVCLPLLDGLELVHAAGFIHRDIKPSNILMREGLGPVLIDFGSARQPLPGEGRELTAIVSRGYAPFEQYDAGNEDNQGPWTDIYGMAATLYQAVSGKLPTEALTRGMSLLNKDPDPLRPAVEAGAPRFSRQLLEAIDAGIAFRATDRPQTVAEWLRCFPSHSAGAARPQVRTEALEISSRALAQLPGYRRHDGDDGHRPTTPESDDLTTLNPGVSRVEFQQYHFLVVDDEPGDRRLAERVLSRLGAGSVILADGGDAALKRLRQGIAQPQVLLCDLDMPHMDGLQLVRELAHQELRLPVILMGGSDDRLRLAAESVAVSHGVRVLGSMKKPLTPDALTLAMRRAGDDVKAVGPEFLDDPVDDDTLRDGLCRDSLELLYQPCVSLGGRQVVGLEALVRWRDGVRLLEPATFLGRIEYLGLSETLTDRVLEIALAQAGEWRAMGISAQLCVNMFAPSLKRLDLPERLVSAAQREGLDPAGITLEVNEHRFTEEGGSPLEVLARLRLRGIGLSLDDFGTGSADLERLRVIPFTELKADRSYVCDAERDAAAHAILESTVALARRLEMGSVAVGVENAATWDLVSILGFDAAQGYYIAPPMCAGDIPGWVQEWERGGVRPRAAGPG